MYLDLFLLVCRRHKPGQHPGLYVAVLGIWLQSSICKLTKPHHPWRNFKETQRAQDESMSLRGPAAGFKCIS